MSPSAALVFGHVATNLGDLAINEGVRELCRRHLPEGDFSVALRRPSPKLVESAVAPMRPVSVLELEAYSSTYEPRVEIKSMLSLLRALANPVRWMEEAGLVTQDVLIGNGGEHLYEAVSAGNHADLLWRVVPLLAAASSGKRVIQMPSTFGPFHTDDGRAILKGVAAVGGELVARDLSSSKFLTEEGLRHTVALDPAFMLPRLESQGPAEKRVAIIPRLEKYGMRLGTASSRYTMAAAKQTGFRDTAAFGWATEIGDRYIRRGWQVDLYIQALADRELVHAIAQELQRRSSPSVVKVYEPTSVTQYRQWLSRSSALVAARFHAVILGLGLGVPSVGVYHLSHGLKMAGLFALINREDGAVELDGRPLIDTVDAVESQVEMMTEYKAQWMSRLRDLERATGEWFSEELSRTPTVSALNESRLSLASVVERVLRERFKVWSDATDPIESRLADIDEKLESLLVSRVSGDE